MAASDWVEIYREYPTGELVELQTTLRAESKNSMSAQGRGTKNYQKDLRELRDKLQAVTRVLRDRNRPEGDADGVVDFSGVTGA